MQANIIRGDKERCISRWNITVQGFFKVTKGRKCSLKKGGKVMKVYTFCGENETQKQQKRSQKKRKRDREAL